MNSSVMRVTVSAGLLFRYIQWPFLVVGVCHVCHHECYDADL